MISTKNYKIVKLQFNAPLQLSKGSIEYTYIDDTLHSDTLKSALFVCALQLFGKDDINDSFFDSFQIGSAFPYWNDVYFFPKPFIKLPLNIKDAPQTEAKKLKKIQWVDQFLFERIILGEDNEITQKYLSKDGKFVSEYFETKSEALVYKVETQQRVQVKYNEDAEPFFTSRIHFHKNAGLFVLIECSDSFFTEKLIPIFRLLGDEGIGSYKHLGNGRFTPSFGNLDMSVPTHATHQLCFSLYCPKKEEIENGLLNDASYQLLKRGGYLANPEDESKMSWRKKSIYMFQEGSVFPAEVHIQGKLADVSPENFTHRVWREGRALFIPIYKKS
ncbi:MAG: type III-A CRISPR-associated RAMP protein Csm4 [Thermoflavifilum sp.]|nr:type III-A CRISPR-associated RAMP protein Csm4 [Thermoflavifilum sp.]